MYSLWLLFVAICTTCLSYYLHWNSLFISRHWVIGHSVSILCCYWTFTDRWIMFRNNKTKIISIDGIFTRHLCCAEIQVKCQRCTFYGQGSLCTGEFGPPFSRWGLHPLVQVWWGRCTEGCVCLAQRRVTLPSLLITCQVGSCTH